MAAEVQRSTVASMLKGIDRYNPENLVTLEKYVEAQARENTYDLEANLAVLKLYQFNPSCYKTNVVTQILLKALTNLPHTDFVLCKCFIDQTHLENEKIRTVMMLAQLLEVCQFKDFWKEIKTVTPHIAGIAGFDDSIRKFVCHVVGITYQTIEKHVLVELLGGISVMTDELDAYKILLLYYSKPDETKVLMHKDEPSNDAQLKQWMTKYGWKELPDSMIFIANQDENIKTKNITEKIDYESVAGIMAACR